MARKVPRKAHRPKSHAKQLLPAASSISSRLEDRYLGDQTLPIDPSSLIAVAAMEPASPVPSIEPFSSHPPYFDIGTEVLYDQIGHRTKDDIRPPSPFSWRKWRTYIVRRNEYLTSHGKWMYHIAEVGGDTLTLAAEEHLIEITFPPHTRVELVSSYNGRLCKGELRKGQCDQLETKWIIKSCRLMGKPDAGNIVYDIENENGDSLTDEKFNVTLEELMLYEGPKPDVSGRYRG